MEWTDESIARLRALWQEGHSTAEIGRRMGITKNAVVGKAHRLDLSARPSPIRKTEPKSDAVPAMPQPKRPVTDRPRTAETSVEARPGLLQPTGPVQAEERVTTSPQMAVPVDAGAPGLDHAAMETAQGSGSTAAVASAQAPADLASSTPVASGLAASALAPTPAPTVPAASASAAPAPATERGGTVHLLRREMPNPNVAPAAPRDLAEPIRAEPMRATVRAAEPRRRGLTCCWPLGEPGTKGFHFCGADPTPGKPYCAEHAALAYVKLRDRRDSVA